MFDVISIGNITIDLYFKGNSLTFKDNRFQLAIGGKYVADTMYQGLGGGGANVAIGVQKNGLRSAILSIIGNNSFKDLILNQLNQNQVSHELCQFQDEFFSLSTILLTPSGERSIVTYETPNGRLFSTNRDYEKLLSAKSVYIANLPEIALGEKVDILSFLKEKKLLTFVNLGVHDCRKPLSELQKFLSLTDILILNAHEWSELVKKPYEQIDFKNNVVTDISFLNSSILIITDGEKGSYGYQKGKVFYCQVEPASGVVDTTGAGDGYTAGFISEYLKTQNLEASMKKGSQYARTILEKIGAN